MGPCCCSSADNRGVHRPCGGATSGDRGDDGDAVAAARGSSGAGTAVAGAAGSPVAIPCAPPGCCFRWKCFLLLLPKNDGVGIGGDSVEDQSRASVVAVGVGVGAPPGVAVGDGAARRANFLVRAPRP